jgi:anti-sigma regulatory factor (Ser/Thr protein kinase)
MRKPGGLGMHLVKATMDSVEYRRQDGRNILTVAFAR